MKTWAHRWLSAGLAVGALPSAWAQGDPCAAGQNNLCVSYSTVTQAVPLSPQLLGLLVLMLGVVAFFKLRHKAGGPLGLVLSLAAGGWLATQSDGSWANGFSRTNLSAGNPVVVSAVNRPQVFVNDLPVNATLTAVTYNGVSVSQTGTLDLYPRCFVGMVLLPATGTDPVGLCVVALPG